MEGMLQEVFLKLLNMSITTGWLILAVLLIRFAFRNQMKGFRCVLWGLVALRLIFPFSIESITSLIPSGEVVPPEIIMDKTPAIDSGIGVVDMVINPIISSNFAPAPGDSVNPLQVVSFVAAIIWIVGVAGMLLYSLISYLLLRKKVSASMQLEDNIYLCDNIDSPFILGIIKPRIYLPSGMEEDYRESVIAHEKAHLKRHDHWWKPLGFFLLSIYWFQPLIWVAYVLLCRDIELACDERVIKGMSDEDKKRYSKALLSCSVTHKMVMVCPLSFGEVGVKARIKSVLNYKKPAFWVMVAAVIIGVVVVVGFMTDPMSGNWYGDKYVNVGYDDEGEEAFWNLIGGVGNKDTAYYRPAIRIDTADEMNAFVEKIGKYFYLEKTYQESFMEVIQGYDAEFYSKKSLVIAYITDGSSGYDHVITKMTTQDGKVDIKVDRKPLPPMTAVPADMAGWFMILPMEDAKLEGKELVVHREGTPREDIIRAEPQAVECVVNAFRLTSVLSESEKELLLKNAQNRYTVSSSKNEHLTVQKFDSKDDFEDFLEAVPGVKKSTTFEMLARKYDFMFFQENSLFIVHMNVGSGSNEFFVNSVYTVEKTLQVEIAQVLDEEDAVETFDVTDWIFTIENGKKWAYMVLH